MVDNIALERWQGRGRGGERAACNLSCWGSEAKRPDGSRTAPGTSVGLFSIPI